MDFFDSAPIRIVFFLSDFSVLIKNDTLTVTERRMSFMLNEVTPVNSDLICCGLFFIVASKMPFSALEKKVKSSHLKTNSTPFLGSS